MLFLETAENSKGVLYVKDLKVEMLGESGFPSIRFLSYVNIIYNMLFICR